jgi:uncharacterized protein (TIGR00290 family)
MEKSKAWLCWSSGKDSAWALQVMSEQDAVEVVGLMTVVTDPYERVSMHGVREDVLNAQAKMTGLPLYVARISANGSGEDYDAAMSRAIQQARSQGITYMVFGDLFLEDVRAYRENQLAGSGITPLFPLWQRPTGELAQQMMTGGLVAHVTCLDPAKAPRKLAGRPFDQDLLEQLPEAVDPCGEYGEFHTCATAGPMFRRPIPVQVGETVERDGFVFTDLSLADPS